VKQHFGYAPLSTAPEELEKPEWMRKAGGPVVLQPEQPKISGYFNVDNGTGKSSAFICRKTPPSADLFAMDRAAERPGRHHHHRPQHGGTDHESFDAVGVPGFQFIQDRLDYETRTHHSNMDTYERLQPPTWRRRRPWRRSSYTTRPWRDQMLPRKPLPHPELDDQRSAPLKVMPGAVEPMDGARN